MYMPLCRDCHARETRLNLKNHFEGDPELVEHWADALAAMVVLVDRAPSTWFAGEEEITALLQRVRDRVAAHLDRSLLSSSTRAEFARADDDDDTSRRM